MAPEFVPEVPANVASRATGPTTITVTWNAPWYAGSSPLQGYDIVVRDSSGAATHHQVDDDHPSAQVTHLVEGETYTFMVAARNESGSSAFSEPCAPLMMNFSLSEAARHQTDQVRSRFAAFRHNSMTPQIPTGAAAQELRDEYRDATQEPDDRFAALRSFRRDEGTSWIPPTSL